jgi:hypothetical protein
MANHKGVTWDAQVKNKKSGNRPQKNGKWGKAEYTVYSISIPSEAAKELGLEPGVKTQLTIRATIAKYPKKKAR